MPTIIGSTTVSANSAATAASTALPPAASISTPAADAERMVGDDHASGRGGRSLLRLKDGAGAGPPVSSAHVRDRLSTIGIESILLVRWPAVRASTR